jgi:hypothetical protein
MTSFTNWLKTFNISTHSIAVIALALAAAYTGYAPFHALVLKYFNMLPGDVQTLVLTGFFIGALYKSGRLFKTVQ